MLETSFKPPFRKLKFPSKKQSTSPPSMHPLCVLRGASKLPKKGGQNHRGRSGTSQNFRGLGHVRPSIDRKSLPREPKMKRQSKKAFGCMNAEPASFPGLIGDRWQITWTNPPFAQILG